MDKRKKQKLPIIKTTKKWICNWIGFYLLFSISIGALRNQLRRISCSLQYNFISVFMYISLHSMKLYVQDKCIWMVVLFKKKKNVNRKVSLRDEHPWLDLENRSEVAMNQSRARWLFCSPTIGSLKAASKWGQFNDIWRKRLNSIMW